MTELVAADETGIALAADILRGGGLVAFPTDTVYGIGCRVGDPAALERLFAAKARPPERQVPVLIADANAAHALGLGLDERAEALAARFWPGPLTLVLPRTDAGDPPTLGVRVPDHPVTRELLGRAGPLATSSANRSGEPEARTPAEVITAFAGVDELDLVVDGGPTPGGVASSVVDLSVTPARLLRESALSRTELEGTIGPLD